MSSPSIQKVQLLRQGGLYIAYSPFLDIATTGKSEDEARGRFQVVLEICRVDKVSTNDICNRLTELGWTQRHKRWTPPVETK